MKKLKLSKNLRFQEEREALDLKLANLSKRIERSLADRRRIQRMKKEIEELTSSGKILSNFRVFHGSKRYKVLMDRFIQSREINEKIKILGWTLLEEWDREVLEENLDSLRTTLQEFRISNPGKTVPFRFYID